MGKHIQKQHPVYISFAKENSANCLRCKFKDHTDVIFQDLIFFKFHDLLKLKTCEVMYRAFNKTLPVNLNNIFTVCEPNCLFNMRKKRFCTEIYSD